MTKKIHDINNEEGCVQKDLRYISLSLHFTATFDSSLNRRFPKEAELRPTPSTPSSALVWVHLHKLVPIPSSNKLPHNKSCLKPSTEERERNFLNSQRARAALREVMACGAFAHNTKTHNVCRKKKEKVTEHNKNVSLRSQLSWLISDVFCKSLQFIYQRVRSNKPALLNSFYGWNCFCASISGHILWQMKSQASICCHGDCYFLFASASWRAVSSTGPLCLSAFRFIDC